MRLFVAIRPDEASLDAFAAAADKLRAASVGGAFTPRENLHLTLAFLGETPLGAQAERAVRKAALACAPFPLVFAGLGRFHQRDGDLYWMGPRASAALAVLHSGLDRALRAEGFPVDARPFRPHVTLGRRVATRHLFDPATFGNGLPEAAFCVDSITLMRSSHEQGRLVYTPLSSHPLYNRKDDHHAGL